MRQETISVLVTETLHDARYTPRLLPARRGASIDPMQALAANKED